MTPDRKDAAMPHPTYLTLTNLLTGQTDRMPRIGIGADAIAAAGADLDRTLAAGGAVPIAVPAEGMTLLAAGNGRAIVATLLLGGVPAMTWGVARRATAGPKLWSILLDQQPSAAERPAWPWIAYYHHPTMAAALTAAWAIDYARCVSWAFIERAAND